MVNSVWFEVLDVEEETKNNNHMEEEVEGAVEEFTNKFRANNEKNSAAPQEYGQVMNLIEDENFNKHLAVALLLLQFVMLVCRK